MEQLETVEGWAIARKQENRGFTCMHCRQDVNPLPAGSCRNHCPYCLWSLHVDDVPGDRASACHGPMAPVGVDYRGAKGFVVVHRCERCGVERRNKAAPDDVDALIELMQLGFARFALNWTRDAGDPFLEDAVVGSRCHR